MGSYSLLLCAYKDSSFVRKNKIFITWLIYMAKADRLLVLEEPEGPWERKVVCSPQSRSLDYFAFSMSLD